MQTPVVSIIVPIYNVEKYLPKCIESILAQTFRDFELILVDDGSPDRCPAICDEYAAKDSRIAVIHQQNAGVSAARNAGLDRARGKYIGFVDPDDWIAPEMYEEMIAAMEQNDVDLAVCGCTIVTQSTKTEARRQDTKTGRPLAAQDFLQQLFDINGPAFRPSVWNKLFRTDHVRGLYFDTNLRISEDLLFLVQYTLRIRKVMPVFKPLYYNFKRQNSATHSIDTKAVIQTVDVNKRCYKMIGKRFPAIKAVVLSWIIQDNMGWSKQLKNNRCYQERKKMLNKMWSFRILGLMNHPTYWKTRIAYFLGEF